jgi:drug/metabolite transporter (DMT)-like permease
MPPSAPSAAVPQRPFFGEVCILAGSLCFSLSIVLVPTIYGSGGNQFAVLVLRNLALAALMAAVISRAGKPLLLPRAERNGSLIVGALFAAQSYCYFTAIQFIPVALATLLNFLYPVLVAVAMHWVSGERLTVAKVGALVAALVGLALALDVTAGELNWLGVVLGFLSACASTGIAVISGRVLGQADTQRMTLHMVFATGVVLLAASQIFGVGLTFPSNGAGWAALGAAPVLYMVAVLGYFHAIRLIGPSRTTMISNVEPICTLILAALLLGEVFSVVQVAGAALVIGAILATQIPARKRA